MSRYPKAEEKAVLIELFHLQSKRFTAYPAEASALLSVGKKQVDQILDPAKTAALTLVANTILNHDETYMKR